MLKATKHREFMLKKKKQKKTTHTYDLTLT